MGNYDRTGERIEPIGNEDHVSPPCAHCRADSMACDIKAGLAGRPCCERCEHIRTEATR